MIQEPPSAEVVRETLEQVLARERIPAPAPEPSALERLLGKLLSGVIDTVGAENLVFLIQVGTITFLVLLLLLGLWSRTRAARRRAAGGRTPGTRARRQRARELWTEALAARDQGDLRLALRLTLFALVVALGEGGLLEFRKGWTDREILRRGAPPPDIERRLAVLLDDLEPKLFGCVAAGPEDLSRVTDLARELAPEVTA